MVLMWGLWFFDLVLTQDSDLWGVMGGSGGGGGGCEFARL